MSRLAELAAVFQIGTRRSPLPKLDLVPDFPEPNPERKLLFQAGAAALMANAGALTRKGCLPFAPCPPEERFVARSSETAIRFALSANLPKAIGEWAVAAGKRGFVAPHRVLPELIDLARKNPGEILPVLGERGRWLAKIEGSFWVFPSEDSFLKKREKDPAAFRDWLLPELANLDNEKRLEAVTALRIHLGGDDEPILEKAIMDRRKEIRTASAKLLAAMDGSRVGREATSLADGCLKHEKSLLRERLIIEPPELEGLPNWIPKLEASDRRGPKAEALAGILSLVPPHHWTHRLRLSPQRLFDLALKTDFGAAILDGISNAAIRFADQEWIDESFAAFHRGTFDHVTDWAQISPLVSEAKFDRIMIGLLQSGSKWSHPLTFCLYCRRQPFSPALTRAFMDNLRFGMLWDNVTEIVYHLDTATAIAAEFVMPEGVSDDTYGKKYRAIVLARHQLLSSLNP